MSKTSEDNILYKLFDACVKAVVARDYDLAKGLLVDIANNDLHPNARALYEGLRSRVPSPDNWHVLCEIDEKSMLADISVILLMTEGSPKALTRSLKSIYRARNQSNLKVHALLMECLKQGTDINLLHEQLIVPLPNNIADAIHIGSLDYMVEYGARKSGLRRAVRTAAGRYVCLMREGDELEIYNDSKVQLLDEYKHDVLIGTPLVNEQSRARQRNLHINKLEFSTVPALLAIGVIYDGAMLFNRDYLDDLLGEVNYDAETEYSGYLNEVATVGLTKQSGKVAFTGIHACRPSPENLDRHANRIQQYTQKVINSRRRESLIQLEAGTESLIDGVLAASREALNKPEVATEDRQNPETDLADAQAGILPQVVERVIYWTMHELRYLIQPQVEEIGLPPRTLPTINDGQAHPMVSAVSSLFTGQKFIHSFVCDITRQFANTESELILVLPEANLVQDLICEIFCLADGRVRLIRLAQDPGIYECWNIGIRNARGRYITNANLDDRRDKKHIQCLVNLLETEMADVASCGIAVTRDDMDVSQFDGDLSTWLKEKSWEVWYTAPVPEVSSKTVKDFFIYGQGGEVIQCMNFPHCMPIWRRSLHDKFGYFNEQEHGTYADFAYWLNAASNGSKFVHTTETLGLYFIDPNSHNRRNSNKVTWEKIVEGHLPAGTKIHHSTHVEVAHHECNNSYGSADTGVPKFNFGEQIAQSYGKHRSGWSYVLSGLSKFHDSDSPVFCDTFIEKKFIWGTNPGEGGAGPVKPYMDPWIGFIHVPPNVPSWFQSEQSNQRIFSRRPWKQSMESCQGLFTMTEYHKEHLIRMIEPDFPISVLYHPTEFPEIQFDFDAYLENQNKRIVQVGWWLRKLNAIGQIYVPGHTPTLLGRSDWSKNILSYAERRYNNLTQPSRIEVLDFLENDLYDQLLAENLVFIDFYDTSANNAIIECIARGTPIFVCRHPAVEEYLGKDYPLYYEDYGQIGKQLSDTGRLKAAVQHLKDDDIRKKVSIEAFIEDFATSEVVRNVYR